MPSLVAGQGPCLYKFDDVKAKAFPNNQKLTQKPSTMFKSILARSSLPAVASTRTFTTSLAARKSLTDTVKETAENVRPDLKSRYPNDILSK